VPVGTAPGRVGPPAPARGGPTVVVLPGPPRELQPMWKAALATEALRAALAGAVQYRRRMLRLFGIPESEIAETLRAAERAGVELGRLEITTCLRRGEIEVVTRYEPDAEDVYGELVALVRARHADTLFSEDGSSVDEQVARLLLGAGAPLTIATAESCTGGLLAARLTELAGSSEYVGGGLVVYSNEAKISLAGVVSELIERHGAVSPEVAGALAEGAREALGAEVGVGITGIAGPGGATELKPVGLVCLSVAGPGGSSLTRSVNLPGGRADVRDRATTVALHMVRRLLVAWRTTER
jgi:nicotinamide-nucleotide amidase